MSNTEHPLTEAEVAHTWDEHAAYQHRDWFRDLASSAQAGIAAALRAAFDAGREYERTNADDGWEPLGRDDELRAGDEVKVVGDYGITRSGVVASIGEDGGPRVSYGFRIGDRDHGTWHVRRAPVTWYRLPTEHPAHLTDVTNGGGDTCAYMALDYCGRWSGVDQDGHFRQWHPRDITACTLDGTRLVRDGEHPDGEPRFREEAGE